MAQPSFKVITTKQQGPGESVEQALYEVRKKIYPRAVRGWFAAWRWALVWATQLVFYGGPWLTWNGRQAVLFEIAQRKFYIFGLVFWPQDIIYLTVLLVIAALSLFLFTAIAGRLWCGYACPQTVYTEIFLWVEKLVEGDRSARIRLDRGKLSPEKVLRKGAKHVLWIAIALWTGFTFVGYFTPIRALWHEAWGGSPGPWATFWILFYGFATYGNAGWMREQVCKYMCPYARFQSAMFDNDTLIVSYLPERGEPRGSRKRSTDYKAQGLGDCIDCTLCVQVCPTGIDIRNGLQYECIACSACIDACDDVMDKMGYPRGLIAYTTENAMRGGRSHILRPRVVVYALLLLTIMSIFAWSLSQRSTLGLDVIRDRNRLYRETDEGRIENVYILKIINMDDKGHAFKLRVEGIEDIELFIDAKRIWVDAGEVLELPVRLRVEEDELHERSNKVTFKLVASDDSGLTAHEEARFLGP
jgi:cytochrome c oxidase accessory protein FixG